MNANDKRASCKVPPMLMQLSGYCISAWFKLLNVFGTAMLCTSEENLPTDHFDSIASDANVNYPVIATRRAHKNPARSLHLDSLFDQDLLLRFGHAVRHHPRGRA